MPLTRVLDPKAFASIVTDNWQIRRRWMGWSLLWMGSNVELAIIWTMVMGGNAMLVQILMALLGAMIAILMFYIFGATYDDHSKRQFGSLISGGDDLDDDDKKDGGK